MIIIFGNFALILETQQKDTSTILVMKAKSKSENHCQSLRM